MARRSRPIPLSPQEARERARDRFVYWCNGVMVLLVVGYFVIPALNWVEVIP